MDPEIEHRLTAVEARAASNTKRIDSLADAQKILSDLATGVKVMGTELKSLSATVNKLDSKVEVLESKPGKTYEAIAEKVILVVITAFVTYFLTHIGL